MNSDVKEFINGLSDDGNIWLVGGANIVKEFLKNNLVDEFIITVFPTLLGEGISLFAEGCGEVQLKLLNIMSYNSGAVQLHYQSVH